MTDNKSTRAEIDDMISDRLAPVVAQIGDMLTRIEKVQNHLDQRITATSAADAERAKEAKEIKDRYGF